MRGYPELLVYGAYGYTGRLLIQHLQERCIPFLVAGRDGRRVADLASEFDVGYRVFGLSEPAEIDPGLDGIRILLNAAGPFLHTARPLLHACLRMRVHYLDVCGEVEPLAYALGLDDQARSANVMILPGVGFDVVPSDCLAVHLARRLPGAERLVIGIFGANLLSHGSALTFAQHAGVPVFTRRRGALEPMRFRTQVRWFNFGDEARPGIAVSWGDLITAYSSTSIPDIEVYFEATMQRVLGITTNQYFGWMFRTPWGQNLLKSYVAVVPSGPDRQQRDRERTVIFAEVSRQGACASARIVTPEVYTFTGMSGAAVVERVLSGTIEPGFQTPGGLLGPDFVLGLPGVMREDLA